MFGVSDPDFSNDAVPDHASRLADHGIAGVVVGKPEHEAGLLGTLIEIQGVAERDRERLFANDVDAVVEKGGGDFVMSVVMRDDRGRFDTVVAFGFRRGHFLATGVDALGIKAQLLAHRLRLLEVPRECAGDEFIAIVDAHGDAVRLPDSRAGAASNHADSNALFH